MFWQMELLAFIQPHISAGVNRNQRKKENNKDNINTWERK